MTTDRDDIRPRGYVTAICATPHCRWGTFVDALDPRLPDGPFDCGGLCVHLKAHLAAGHAIVERATPDGERTWCATCDVEAFAAIPAVLS